MFSKERMQMLKQTSAGHLSLTQKPVGAKMSVLEKSV